MSAPTGQTAVYAVLGHPVGRSASPALMNAVFEAWGLDAVYVALPVAPEAAPGAGAALRTLGLAGANLTVPLKEAVLPTLDALGPSARAAGAANCVVREGGRLIGHNTDGDGLLDALAEDGLPDVRGAAAVLLGAGGAARAVGAALLGAGIGRLTVLNRSPARAAALADGWAARFPRARVESGPLVAAAFGAAAAGASLVVHLTAAGGPAALPALPVAALAAGARWVDTNYWDRDPPLASEVRAAGHRFLDGRGMFVGQAARSLEHFVGRRPPFAWLRGMLPG